MVRFFSIHVRMPVILLGILDALVVYYAIAGALALSYAPESVLFSFFADGYALQKIVFVSITLMSLFVVGVYTRAFLTDMKMGLVAIIVGHFIALAVLSLAFYLYQDARIWIRALAPGLILSLVGVFLTHLIFDRIVGTHIFKRNLLVIGTGPLARKIAVRADPDSTTAFVQAVERLVGDPALRGKLGGSARTAIVDQDLTWDNTACRVVALAQRTTGPAKPEAS